MSENNNKSLFGDKKLPDYENTGDTLSQSQTFNNKNYVKKWHMYWDTLSTDINVSNNWKLGDKVEIVSDNKEYAWKKGVICLGFSKNPEMLCVKFKDGSKAFVDKMYVKKISIYDFLDEK